MRMAEQQDLETDADFLPEQEELIQSATETIGTWRACAALSWVQIYYSVLVSFYSIVP